MQQGVFAQEEIGFGRITDSPREAVDLIVRGLPPAVKARLQPAAAQARIYRNPGLAPKNSITTAASASAFPIPPGH